MDARAVLWDLDGTLIDTTEQHWQSWLDVLGPLGVTITRAQFEASYGMRNDATVPRFLGHDPGPDRVAEIAHAKERRYREIVRDSGVALAPGVGALLDGLHRAGWRQALATSAPRENVDALLDAVRANGAFDAVVTAEDVSRGKPHPDVFLAAAEKVGVPPARCVVIEDAIPGTEAARRAGMKCVGVLASVPRLEADLVVRSLEEVDADRLDALVG